MSNEIANARREPPAAGDETATLLGSLERQRAIFAWKCSGVDANGLAKTFGPSTLTLGGLLKHLALVEDDYFTRRLHGRKIGPPWDSIDWNVDPDWEFRSAREDSPDELMALWEGAVARSPRLSPKRSPTAESTSSERPSCRTARRRVFAVT